MERALHQMPRQRQHADRGVGTLASPAAFAFTFQLRLGAETDCEQQPEQQQGRERGDQRVEQCCDGRNDGADRQRQRAVRQVPVAFDIRRIDLLLQRLRQQLLLSLLLDLRHGRDGFRGYRHRCHGLCRRH